MDLSRSQVSSLARSGTTQLCSIRGACRNRQIGLSVTPLPAHVVNLSELVEISTQAVPFARRIVPAHRVASHERVDARGSIQYRLDIRTRGFMVVKVMAECLCLFVKLFYKPIDVVFLMRSVQATLVELRIEC